MVACGPTLVPDPSAQGQDQTLTPAGGGSRGSCWRILQEMFISGGRIQTLCRTRNSGSKALLEGNARHSVGAPSRLLQGKEISLQTNVLLWSQQHRIIGGICSLTEEPARHMGCRWLTLCLPPPVPLKPGQSHCYPCIPWPSPRINTVLSKRSLFLIIHQENSIQSVQKNPPHSIIKLKPKAP